MKEPRPEKAAIVAEVRDRVAQSDAVLLTEFRGLDVAAMAELRRSVRAAGGEYTIYKNTLVRIATAKMDFDLGDLLTGPTAMAFTGRGPDGAAGDAAALAKALRDFSRTHRSLVLKGGVLDGSVIGAADVVALAELPPRDVMLAHVAGAFAAPLAMMAGLLQAMPRNFAYALKALIDEQGTTADESLDGSGT